MRLNDVLRDLRSDRVKKVILDTDAYNEVDDQFAIAWAILENGKKINLHSINAAPFLNSNSVSAEDGMIKSYDEIFKLVKLIDESGYDITKKAADVPVFKGSTRFMTPDKEPVISDAAENIVKTVSESDEVVYVVAIGAITNVASAIRMKPEIINNMVVIWLGGHAWDWKITDEFNMRQDVPAAQVVLDSKVPFVQIPCNGVCTALTTTAPELKYYLDGKTPLSQYLSDNVVKEIADYDVRCRGRVIWDVSAMAMLLIKDCADVVTLPTPFVTPMNRYAFDAGRHPMLMVRALSRDKIFTELFNKLTKR